MRLPDCLPAGKADAAVGRFIFGFFLPADFFRYLLDGFLQPEEFIFAPLTSVSPSLTMFFSITRPGPGRGRGHHAHHRAHDVAGYHLDCPLTAPQAGRLV